MAFEMTKLVLSAMVIQVLILYIIRKNKISGLQSIPNAHFTAPYSNAWLSIQRWRQRSNRCLVEAHRRTGSSVVRVGPNELSINCMDDGVRTVFGAAFDRADWYELGFEDQTPYMLLMGGRREHAARRRLLAGAYTKAVVWGSNTLSETGTEVLEQLREEYAAAAASGKPGDMLGAVRAAVMDVSTAFIYGGAARTHFISDPDAKREYIGNSFKVWKGMFWRTQFPLAARAGRLLGWDFAASVASAARVWLHRWALDRIRRAEEAADDLPSPNKRSTQEQKSVYAHFRDGLRLTTPANSKYSVNDMVVTELSDHVLASQDIGASVMAYVIYSLSKRPDMQAALRWELRAAFDEPVFDDQAKVLQLDGLPILHAVFMETLRRYPPSPGPWPRIVPAGGAKVGPFENVPEGTVVCCSVLAVHDNEDVFSNPSEWKPERWLEADEEQKREMNKWFWAFGSGSRSCIGMHVAIRTLKSTIAAIYYDFATTVTNDSGMEQIDGVIAGPVGDAVIGIISKV